MKGTKCIKKWVKLGQVNALEALKVIRVGQDFRGREIYDMSQIKDLFVQHGLLR